MDTDTEFLDCVHLCSSVVPNVVVVVPFFLAKGVHINKDIPELLGLPEGSFKGRLVKNGSEIPLVYADPIGSDPLLAELMLKNAARALRERL